MAGVSQQTDAAHTPFCQRCAAHQRPFVGRCKIVDHVVDIRVPAVETGVAFLMRTMSAPRFNRPAFNFDDAVEIHVLAAMHGVMHHMPARPHPIGANHAAHAGWQFLQGYYAAPRHHAGVDGFIVAKQRLPHTRMHTIRTDQCVAGGQTFDTAAFITQRNTLLRMLKAAATRIQMNRIRFLASHTVGQYCQQIRAICQIVWKSITFNRLYAHFEQLPRLTAVPKADFLAFSLACQRTQRVKHTEFVQHTNTIGA